MNERTLTELVVLLKGRTCLSERFVQAFVVVFELVDHTDQLHGLLFPLFLDLFQLLKHRRTNQSS